MPFGGRLVCHSENATRGPGKGLTSHQCLSAGGWFVTPRLVINLKTADAGHQCLSAGGWFVTSCLPTTSSAASRSHQCLSAGGWFVTRSRPRWVVFAPPGVTNAFRREVGLSHRVTLTRIVRACKGPKGRERSLKILAEATDTKIRGSFTAKSQGFGPICRRMGGGLFRRFSAET